MPPAFETTPVLGRPYAELDYASAADTICNWAHERTSKYVVVAPVSSLMMSKTQPRMRAAFDDADMITSDGMPIVWARKLMGRKHATRLYGPTLMLSVLQRCESQGIPIALVGGRPERVSGLVAEIKRRYPRIKIHYVLSPPFRALTDQDVAELAAGIRDSEARVTFVAIGSPKQEDLMRRLKPRIRGVQIGVGAAFDFIPGYVKQAPSLLQRLGLEWAFRIACEPRRLWKRYATTIPPFVFGVSMQIARHQLTKPNRAAA